MDNFPIKNPYAQEDTRQREVNKKGVQLKLKTKLTDLKKGGFIKFYLRGEAMADLMKNYYPAVLLLLQIGSRVRWNDSQTSTGLNKGQAFIGDYNSIGITEHQYRKAKDKLQKMGLVTFKASRQGTIATLVNSEVFEF